MVTLSICCSGRGKCPFMHNTKHDMKPSGSASSGRCPLLAKMGYQFSFQHVQPLLSAGFVIYTGNRIILASRGYSVIDSITTQLVADLTPIA